MKKQILSAVVTMLCTLMARAGDSITVRSVFVEMPDTVIPYLSRNSRMDFIDFMDSNMKAEVTNKLGGRSVMTALAGDSLSVQLNETARLDMLLLPTMQPVDSCMQVVCLVTTYGLPSDYQESTVAYFTAKWKPLDSVPPLTAEGMERVKQTAKSSNILKFVTEKLNK